MKKVLLGILVLALVGAGIWMYKVEIITPTSSVHNDKDVVKIGVMWPLSGDAGYMGESAKVALKLFAEDHKTKNSKYDYEIVLEDNQLNPAKSAIIAKKMIEVDKVNAIITIGSNIGNAVAPISERAKVLQMAIASAESIAEREYNFLIATPPNKEAEKLIVSLKKNDIKNVALVTQNQAAMLSFTEAFKKINKDIEILSDDYINAGEKDYKILIAKMLRNNPDIVIANIYVPEISIFVKQLKEAKPDVKVTAMESLAYPEDKSLFEGYWFVDAVVAEKSFVKRFEEVSGSDAIDYSYALYASLEFLRDSFNKVGKDTQKVADDFVFGGAFDTVMGKVSFDPKGIMQSEASLKVIVNGKPVVIEE